MYEALVVQPGTGWLTDRFEITACVFRTLLALLAYLTACSHEEATWTHASTGAKALPAVSTNTVWDWSCVTLYLAASTFKHFLWDAGWDFVVEMGFCFMWCIWQRYAWIVVQVCVETCSSDSFKALHCLSGRGQSAWRHFHLTSLLPLPCPVEIFSHAATWASSWFLELLILLVQPHPHSSVFTSFVSQVVDSVVECDAVCPLCLWSGL